MYRPDGPPPTMAIRALQLLLVAVVVVVLAARHGMAAAQRRDRRHVPVAIPNRAK